MFARWVSTVDDKEALVGWLREPENPLPVSTGKKEQTKNAKINKTQRKSKTTSFGSSWSNKQSGL
jgi:hypothetical protein